MAEPCPICFRAVTADPAALGPNLCTKRVDSQQWRRTECFNVGLSARNEQLAAERALNERLCAQLIAAEDVITKAKDMRARLREVDGSGSATIYFAAALTTFERLAPRG